MCIQDCTRCASHATRNKYPINPHRHVLLCTEGRGHSVPGLHPVLHVRGAGPPAAHDGERPILPDGGAGLRPSSLLARRAQGRGERVATDAEVCGGGGRRLARVFAHFHLASGRDRRACSSPGTHTLEELQQRASTSKHHIS